MYEMGWFLVKSETWIIISYQLQIGNSGNQILKSHIYFVMESIDENKNDIISNIICVIEKKYEDELEKLVKVIQKQNKEIEKLKKNNLNYISENNKLSNNIKHIKSSHQTNIKNLELENQSLYDVIRNNNKEIIRIKDFYNSPNNNPDMKIELDALKIKYQIKQIEFYDLEKDKNTKNRKIKDLETKLNNQQRFLKENGIIKSLALINGEINTTDCSNDSDQKASLGNKMDGSDGFHFDRRESGKFGSLPSFDNYDDEYNENFDNEI